jgi:hypothetical protein
MKKVLIASTYYESHKSPDSNKIWLRLQDQFIESNTASYDFAVYLNGVKDKELYKKYEIVGINDDPPKESILSHRSALRAIIDFFKSSPGYESYCILDSDCFPVRKGWYYDLHNIVIERGKKFAAVVRFENGETFPHPCAMLIPADYLYEGIIDFSDDDLTAHSNIIDGTPIRDTGSCNSFYAGSQFVGHPLVRTNAVNAHPIFAGIYGDLFYHHGLGSRCRHKDDRMVEPANTYRTKNYWGYHGKSFFNDVSTLFDMIADQPDEFINRLRGVGLKVLPPKKDKL